MANDHARQRWLGEEIEDALSRPDTNSLGVVGWILALTDLPQGRQYAIIDLLARRDVGLADVVSVGKEAR